MPFKSRKMTSYNVFYNCYSSGASAEQEAGVKMNAEQIIADFPRMLVEPDDFFGIIDPNGVTLQFMRNRLERVWMEIPCPEKDGSYARHSNMAEVIELLKSLPETFESLKSDLVFQHWDGENEEKLFAIPDDLVKKLIDDHGVAFATDHITCQDLGIGYMYRETPEFEEDSGWRFLSGEEDQAYMDVAENSGIYEVNTIANYDPDIIPFLNSPVGSAFARNDDDQFVPADELDEEELEDDELEDDELEDDELEDDDEE